MNISTIKGHIAIIALCLKIKVLIAKDNIKSCMYHSNLNKMVNVLKALFYP